MIDPTAALILRGLLVIRSFQSKPYSPADVRERDRTLEAWEKDVRVWLRSHDQPQALYAGLQADKLDHNDGMFSE